MVLMIHSTVDFNLSIPYMNVIIHGSLITVVVATVHKEVEYVQKTSSIYKNIWGNQKQR